MKTPTEAHHIVLRIANRQLILRKNTQRLHLSHFAESSATKWNKPTYRDRSQKNIYSPPCGYFQIQKEEKIPQKGNKSEFLPLLSQSGNGIARKDRDFWSGRRRLRCPWRSRRKRRARKIRGIIINPERGRGEEQKKHWPTPPVTFDLSFHSDTYTTRLLPPLVTACSSVFIPATWIFTSYEKEKNK